MNAAFHTPAPWKLNQEYGNLWRIMADDNQHVIAEIPTVGLGNYQSANGTPLSLDEIGKANAALVSAAPELLNALQDLLAWLPAPYNEGQPADQARAAIAKAKGGAK